MRCAAGLVSAAAACVALAACDRAPPAEQKSERGIASRVKAAVAAPFREKREPVPAPTSSPRPSPSPTTKPAPTKITLTPPIGPAAGGVTDAPETESGSASTPAETSPPAAGAPGVLRSYPPKNECASLPGFAAFRTKLANALRERDADAVAALADPAIKLDFGGGSGRDELRRRLTQTRPELWSELGRALQLGCAYDNGLATMPWIFSRMPEKVDAYEALLVLGENVPLREKPAADAPARGTLNWALVTSPGQGFNPKARFVEVETVNKALRGYVEGGRLRSLLDYRVIAERQGDTWAITAFIAGD